MTLLFLAQRPDLRRRLFSEPALISSAVNELLRLFSPIQIFCRTAVSDIELHGKTISAGDVVALSYAGANRDPREFPAPDDCMLDRKPNRHLAFGFGHHLCLGANVARLEMAIMLERFAHLAPDFWLDPERPPQWKARGDVRGLLSLYLQLESASAN